MKPILFHDLLHHIGIEGVPAFFFMIMIATFAAAYAAVKFAEQDKLSVVYVLDMAIIAVIASMLGSRIFHILVEAPDYYGVYPWDPSLFVRMFYFWQGGFVSFGAFLATTLGWVAYLRYRKANAAQYFDNMARVAPIIIFFVRVGCLLAGCCYGRPTDFPIHLVFTDPASTAYHFFPGIPLHAAQIYAMANAVVLYFVLAWVHTHRKFYGQIVASFLIGYGLQRGLIEEVLRGDADRGIYFGNWVSTGQIVSLGFIVGGLLVWACCRNRYKLSSSS